MAINLEKKSNRLLGNRRFTSADLNTSQEAFTDVLDIGADEIYTQTHLIPSSNLPFSGSTQSGQTSGVLKYYCRQRLTRSNVANDVFFFMVPTGSTGGVTPQLIQDNQQTNFISPKYSVSSLANANTEDTTPGYGVKVFKSTSLDSASLSSGDIVSTNDYQFDYKTGVLQFESALASNLEVYMSVYQYVGKTLRTGLFIDGDITANNYIVSSSVTNITTQELSGSTKFGDSTDDTHQFTGSLSVDNFISVPTASFNIISGSLVPDSANLYDLGSAQLPWRELYILSSSINFNDSSNQSVGKLAVDTEGLSLEVGLPAQRVKQKIKVDRKGIKVESPDGSLSVYSGSTFFGEPSSSNDLMVLKNSSGNTMFKIDNSGTVVLGTNSPLPTAQEGAIAYSGSDFYLGFAT
tara:strand:+ start:110 stop:1330 length:1221 start_codon:yes stop_codon:yes gene_type:complete